MAIGLLVGFLIGYFVYIQTNVKVICRPTNQVLADTERKLPELLLRVDVGSCESVEVVLGKSNPIELFTKDRGTSTVTEGGSPGSETGTTGSGSGSSGAESSVRNVPEPPRSQEPPLQSTEPQNSTKTEYLEIFDICSGKIEVSAQLIEGLEWCLNKKYPYNIILEKSSKNMKTNFYDGGFSETYSLSNSFVAFRLFVQDVAITGVDIQAIEIHGPLKDYFSIGNYTTDNIWQKNLQTGQMEIIKTVINIPLSVSKNIPTTDSWKNLNFYIKTTDEKYFYIGTVWIYVISS